MSWLYFLHFRIKEVYSNAQLSVSLCSGSCFSKWSCMEHQACSYEMDARHLSQSRTAQPAPSRGHNLILIKKCYLISNSDPCRVFPPFRSEFRSCGDRTDPHFRTLEPSPPSFPTPLPFFITVQFSNTSKLSSIKTHLTRNHRYNVWQIELRLLWQQLHPLYSHRQRHKQPGISFQFSSTLPTHSN